MTAHHDAAFCSIVEAGNEAHQCGLGAACTAEDAYGHAALNMEIDVTEIPLLAVGVILKIDMIEVDVAILHRQFRSGILRHGGLMAQHLGNTLAAGDGTSQHHQHHGHHHQGRQNFRGVGEEGHQIAREHDAVRHIVSADPHQRRNGAAHQQRNEGHEGHHETEGPLGSSTQILAAETEFLLLLTFADEGFHHAHGVDILLHHQVQGIGGALELRKEGANHRNDDGNCHNEERDGHQEHTAQLTADPQRQHQRRNQHHRSADADAGSHEDRALHRGHIVGQTGNEGRGGKMLQIRKGEVLDLSVLRGADFRAEAHGGTSRGKGRAYAEQQGQHRQDEHLQTHH